MTVRRFLRAALPSAAALALGVLLSLGGLELATRVLAIAPPLPHQNTFAPDDVLPWKEQPNVSSRRRIRRNGGSYHYYHFRHNSLGFRGRDHEFEKPPGVFRIVVIGDSFTYGVGASEGATYPDRIEAALDARSPDRVEVINLGVRRYWPEPEALVLEHYGLRYSPDLVITGVPANDFNDTRAGTATRLTVSRGYLITSRGQRLGVLGRWLYLNSHVARTLIAEVLARNPEAPDPGMEDDEAVWARMRDAWSRMIGLARGAGAQIVFLHVPQKGPWEDGSHETPTRLQKLCANRECIAIDALPAMRAHPDPESLHYPKDGHCTEAGYALIADVVVRELDVRGMLPKTLRLADRSGAASIPLGGR